MDQPVATDRYVSFCGIECDTWANELITHLNQCLEDQSLQQWKDYFTGKFAEQRRMGHNNLFFVGAQMNNLYSFFEELEDEDALALLWKLEQECC